MGQPHFPLPPFHPAHPAFQRARARQTVPKVPPSSTPSLPSPPPPTHPSLRPHGRSGQELASGGPCLTASLSRAATLWLCAPSLFFLPTRSRTRRSGYVWPRRYLKLLVPPPSTNLQLPRCTAVDSYLHSACSPIFCQICQICVVLPKATVPPDRAWDIRVERRTSRQDSHPRVVQRGLCHTTSISQRRTLLQDPSVTGNERQGNERRENEKAQSASTSYSFADCR